MVKRLFTYQEVYDDFKNNGCTLLSEEYLGSKHKLKYQCSCGNVAEIEYRVFREGKRCKMCRDKRASETNKRNHGGKHCFQTDEFKSDREAICLEKYGVKSPLQSPVIKKNREKTNLEKYGVVSVSQVAAIRQKQQDGFFNKYGVHHFMLNPFSREKFHTTLMNRYGVPNLSYLSKCCSKESQKLFWEIHKALPVDVQPKSHFAELNSEFVVRKNGEFFKYDFVNSLLKKGIEYNGTKFHPTTNQLDEEINWCVFHPQKTVLEAREYEQRKYSALTSRAYSILTVWDTEFHNDFSSLVKKCLDFLTKDETEIATI